MLQHLDSYFSFPETNVAKETNVQFKEVQVKQMSRDMQYQSAIPTY